MRHVNWAAIGLLAVSGCAGGYEPQTASPAVPSAEPVRPPIETSSQPGCHEPEHQAFPPSGSYVAVDEIAEAVTRAAPHYPDAGREGRVQGTVLLRALVCEHGRAVKTEVVQSIPLLDEAAAQAVTRWTFRPARSGGRAVAVWVDVPIRFTLH